LVQEHEGIAHADQPIREGNVHISAPHMYGTVLEALELKENTSMSFLNVGSGTGYMNCLVATILGPYSTNYGVEIQQDVIDHCDNSIARWKAVYDGKLPHMKLIHGNALNISMHEGEALIGFDRIYIGASITRNSLFKLMSLLKTRGVLIGPGKACCTVRPFCSLIFC
jgi:protein-L-isoaspartate O-methyltransferase